MQEHPSATGRILHFAAGYDLLAWLLTRGRGRSYRDRLLDLAHIQRGERVLDVGCGTGSLAIAAKMRVGPSGTVDGIDASPEMIGRAKRKARNAGVDACFQQAVAEKLPFGDASFDVALSTLMVHHLPREARKAMAREIARTLRPAGRVLVVDFGSPSQAKRTLVSRLHRHGHTRVDDNIALLSEAGLRFVESGEVGIGDLHFALAIRPAEASL